MDWGLVALVFLHIGGGAIWLGASAFANFVVIPYLTRQPPDRRQDVVTSLVLGPERLIIGAAVAAGVSGIALGLGYRGFGTSTSLTTPAGVVWLLSIAIAVVVFGVGGRVTSPAARAVRAGSPAADDGRALLSKLRTGFRIELAGIVAILGLMILLPQV
jgi:uncharacterized membrane protein